MISSITDARNRFSALLDRVKAGETVTITDRGRPVAKLVPADSADEVDWDARLQRLAREGLVRLPQKKVDVDEFLARARPKPTASVVEALLEERREGR
jgi:prevent-host-death family protein